MRIRIFSVLAVFAGFTCFSAFGDLHQVEVGGQITILGEYYRNMEPAATDLRWGSAWLSGRPTGGPIFGIFGWDNDGGDLSLVTQWTRLHVKADFTEDVSAFIEFDSVDVWGEDFRSQDYVTGIDTRADTSVDDIEIYQAYIDIANILDHNLSLRIGRQELSFGSEWLVGPNTDGPIPVWGLSFDAIRMTWAPESFNLDAFFAKLSESFGDFADDDIDFYGIYASYQVMDAAVLDAYWFWLRDDAAHDEIDAEPIVAWLDRISGAGDYSDTDLHTVGLRFAGEFGNFDIESEVAYQFGDASRIGAMQPAWYFGDDDADFDEWALNLEVGYTFDLKWQPRPYLAYAYFGGEDRRDIAFGQWLAGLFNPFYAPQASVSFNRLFSNWTYSGILDGSDLSNIHIFHTGVSVLPTENIEIAFDLGYFRTDAAFRRPVVPLLGFWSRRNPRELGFETDLSITWNYSEDLYFCFGWDHLFVGEGLEEGHFNSSYGLEFNGGSDDDDADFFYFETGISF